MERTRRTMATLTTAPPAAPAKATSSPSTKYCMASCHWEAKPRGHYPGYRVPLAIHRESLASNFRIAAQAAPERARNHRQIDVALLAGRLAEPSPHHRRNAQTRGQRRRHLHSSQVLWLARGGQVELSHLNHTERVEAARSLLVVQQIQPPGSVGLPLARVI